MRNREYKYIFSGWFSGRNTGREDNDDPSVDPQPDSLPDFASFYILLVLLSLAVYSMWYKIRRKEPRKTMLNLHNRYIMPRVRKKK